MEELRQRIGVITRATLGMALVLVCLRDISEAETISNKALPKSLESFLEEHCFDCHDDITSEGDLDLYNLPFDLDDSHTFDRWAYVFDRIKHDEMPPKEEVRPDSGERASVLKDLRDLLLNADRSAVKKAGRVNGRRLTRVEYEHSLHDLLGTRLPLKHLLPADESEHEFETVADSQQLSHFHLNQYLSTADAALLEVLGRVRRGDVHYQRHFKPKELGRWIRSTGENYRGPEARGGKVYSWERKAKFNGSMRATRVPKDGWYRITVKNLTGINPGPDGSVWGTLRTGAGLPNEPIHLLASIVEGVPEGKDFVVDAWMKRGHLVEIRPEEAGNKSVYRNKEDEVYYQNRKLEDEGISGLSFDGISVQRVYPGGSRAQLKQLLLPGVVIENGLPVLEDPKVEIARLIRIFADKAFRRPVSSAILEPYSYLALERYDETNDLYEALREGYRAILCSPRFLTFVEKPGVLDDHALATRLSYFLWSSVPDSNLRRLANQKKLHNPEVLAGEIERLLNSPKSDRFINNFTDQWLSLNEIDFTSPDPRRFRNFDHALQDSMLQETRAFVRELINNDQGVRNLVHSDFLMLNTRLRKHYDLGDLAMKPGRGIQRVEIGPQYRSGLVTQGAILKVTADGSVTSPVVRGVWVGERILGLHIPPPPGNVPAIEPDIRGATSIRDQLEKHRSSKSCAACHVKIDPPGFALESFDPVGQWREYYGRPGASAEVDPTGVTPEGVSFKDIGGWKREYVRRPKMLAKAFTSQLMAYGTGASVRFSDRSELEKIVSKTKVKEFGLRSLLREVVLSETFHTK